jgi:transposase-like protein
VVEEDHRFLKERIAANLGFRSVEGALHTIDAYQTIHMIRKGQVRWLARRDVLAQRAFIHSLFGIDA